MNILLTNDDGIHSEGINAVYSEFSQKHAVYVIAPESERSAGSHAITVRAELSIKRIAQNKFSVGGFPADCVIIGLSGDIIPDVDLIISGINHGPNVGDDCIFSGTVAAARTAYIFGKAAVAISINCYKRASRYVNDAARFLIDVVDEMTPEIIDVSKRTRANSNGDLPAGLFFNINYPDLPPEGIKGKMYTSVGRRIYRDSFQKTTFESNEATVRMGGYIESIFFDGTDTTELEKGYITISPLMTDCTDYSYLKKISQGLLHG